MGDQEIEQWVERAKLDLEAAEALDPERQGANIAFLSHQALEKLLKALYLGKKKKRQPRHHELVKLVECCGLSDILSETHSNHLKELDDVFEASKYPNAVIHPAFQDTVWVTRTLARTKEAFNWLLTQLR